MKVVCCVKGCESNSANPTHGLFFYPFPWHPKRRQQWLSILPLKGMYHRTAKVCNLHFTQNQFSVFRPNRLVRNAIPYNIKYTQPHGAGKVSKTEKQYEETDQQTCPVTCETCARMFVSQEELNAHTLVAHDHTSVRTDENKMNLYDSSLGVSMRYECLSCKTLFKLYNEAMEHFREVHSRDGKNLQPLKQVSVQECQVCGGVVTSLLMHLCTREEFLPTLKKSYVCMLCEYNFTNIRMFDNHIWLRHNNHVEKLFFPSIKEFINWKQDMESETDLNYSLIEDLDDKKIYHCNHYNDVKEQKKVIFCPAAIVAQEFQTGIQVNHYRKHSQDHGLLEEKLPNNKKYDITQFLKSPEKEMSDVNDEYLQFKMLLDNIILESAKLNSTSLKLLMGKALDMTAILINYDEDVEDGTSKTDFADSIDNKRPLHTSDEPSKKCKVDMSPKIINSFSLATEPMSVTNTKSELNDIDEEILKSNKINKMNSSENQKELKDDSNIVKESQDSKLDKGLTFNDTYKDFVSKTFDNKKCVLPVRRTGIPAISKKLTKPLEASFLSNSKSIENQTAASMTKHTPLRISTIFNNNDGQVCPNKNIATSDGSEPSTDACDAAEISEMVDIKEETPSEASMSPGRNDFNSFTDVSMSTSDNDREDLFNDYSNFDTAPEPKITNRSPHKYSNRKKIIVKTKIGQFNPLKSVKVERQKDEKINTLSATKKVDLVYEVIEQDADCNILVLKM